MLKSPDPRPEAPIRSESLLRALQYLVHWTPEAKALEPPSRSAMHASFLLSLLLATIYLVPVSPTPYCPMTQIMKMGQYRFTSEDECRDLEEPDWYGLAVPDTDTAFHDLCCKKKFCDANHIRFFWCYIRPRVG